MFVENYPLEKDAESIMARGRTPIPYPKLSSCVCICAFGGHAPVRSQNVDKLAALQSQFATFSLYFF